MPRLVSAEAAVRVVAAVVARHRPATVFVGVDGLGGAGKSTLAARLAGAVSGATVISVDDFCGPHVTEWDWGRFHRQVVAPLQAGRSARYQRWAWDWPHPGEWVAVPPGRLVVVEGVSATRREGRVPWALTIWVQTAQGLRQRRLLDRDGPAAEARWRGQWLPSERAYQAAQAPQLRADLVVAGTDLS